jgi:hypothetical protein
VLELGLELQTPEGALPHALELLSERAERFTPRPIETLLPFGA